MSKIKNAIEEYRQHGPAYVLRHISDRTIEILTEAIGKLLFVHLPLKDVIIIESHNDFDCNGGAFYQYLLVHGLNRKYRIVWLIRNKKPEELPENVICLDYDKPSLRKEFYCCVARFLFNDDKFTEKRRNGQICVYCTHGAIALKNTRGLIVVPDYVDYILSPSKWYDPYLCREYSVDYPNERMLHVGFPANDLLFNGTENECGRIRDKRFSKYILWMPTFRSNSRERNDSEAVFPFGIPLINTREELKRVNEFCGEHNCLLIIKIHPMQLKESYQALEEMSNIAVLDGEKAKACGVDNYRLMRCCDAMISDFSSAPYSFLLLNRPIAFDFSDLASYKLGLNVDNSEIEEFTPGEKIYSIDDLIHFVGSVVNEEDRFLEQRSSFLKKAYEYQDGNASRRLAAFLGLTEGLE